MSPIVQTYFGTYFGAVMEAVEENLKQRILARDDKVGICFFNTVSFIIVLLYDDFCKIFSFAYTKCHHFYGKI